MSRLAKKPILIPDGTTATLNSGQLLVKGPKGEKQIPVLRGVKISFEEKSILFQMESDSKENRTNVGTMWSLSKNAVSGVNQEFKKILEIEGVGFKANFDGKRLVLSLGFSHPVYFDPPAGITILVEKNQITISGIDKESVGQAAAQIRAFKKPEPYKGKGIHYQGEVIRRKAGKKAATTSS